mmetsp:Transcript_34277/g.90424  ORF Transcript_34277/g.90424 Transcript_34277/m.90424 type:complete len:425 (+) Transcript_34277:98-1372(+)
MLTRLVLYTTALLGAKALDSTYDSEVEHAFQSIRDSFPVPLVVDYATCSMSANEPCALDAMPDDETTVVYPGGETRCIFDQSISGNFGFQVIPGNSSKGLLLFYQGGGACWDEASTKVHVGFIQNGRTCNHSRVLSTPSHHHQLGLCTTSAVPSGGGVFDRNDEANPYHDWTVVQVLYCSGDVHGGAVVRDYNDKASKPVTQTGAANAQAVLDWILAQREFASGTTEVVLTGSSAGCMGVQLWADSALEQLSVLNFKRTAVIPDSFVGYFPPGTESPLINQFGYCDTAIISPGLVADCKANRLLFKDVVANALGKNSEVPFAYINSKEDAVQIGYYIAIAATFGRNVSSWITPSMYYTGVNAMLEYYANNGHTNMLMYMVSSPMHTYMDDSFMYTAGAKGLFQQGDFGLIDYISTLPLWNVSKM